MTHASATALATVISLGTLWILFFWVYRAYRVDSFRQQLFALRDELFDYVTKSNVITFDHGAYGTLRTVMNGHIRFAHRLNFISVLVFSLRVRTDDLKSVEGFREKWQQRCAELPAPVQQELKGFADRMDFLVAKHVILSSPLMWILILPVLVVLLFRHLGQASMRALRNLWQDLVGDRIDSAAMAMGRPG